MTKLTAIVLTYNEADHIQACLETLTFADKCVVYDSFSTDETVQIARDAGAEVIRHEFENYASKRNAALEYIKGETDWVLFVDADERVEPDLAEEIRTAIASTQYVAFRIPRYNYLFGKLTTGAGWYPDYQTRLLKVGKVHYDPQRTVHEVAVIDGVEGTLTQHFTHYNYENFDQFIAKQQRYVHLDARMMYDDGIKPKVQNYILQPLRHFRWRFFELKGYSDGWHGFRLSATMAWYELRKYLLLRGLWKQHGEA